MKYLVFDPKLLAICLLTFCKLHCAFPSIGLPRPRAKMRSCYFQMLLFFCPSITWFAFYICNTQKLGLLFKQEKRGVGEWEESARGRERERMSDGKVPLQPSINQASCSHTAAAAAAAIHQQMGICRNVKLLLSEKSLNSTSPTPFCRGFSLERGIIVC